MTEFLKNIDKDSVTHRAGDHAVGLERPQRDGQHTVRNVAQRTVDLAEPHKNIPEKHGTCQ